MDNAPGSLPVIAVLVASADDDPPGLGEAAEVAELRVVRDREDLRAALQESRVLVVYDFRTTFVHDLGDAVSHLEWVHAASAGVDAVLTPAVLRSGCVVTNARGVFDRPIAEYCMALLLGFVKDLPATLRLQADRRWRHRETRSLAGRHLLVVGAGSIGAEVGRLGAALGMAVRGVARRERADHPVFGRVRPAAALHTELAWADDVVIATPLSEDTRGMVDAAAFAAMRPGTHLINVGRGPVIDEAALLDALRSGVVAAAGLDVFEREPLPPEHPFWGMEQVVVSPHMSGDEIGWREALGRQFTANLHRWRRGEPLEHVIDTRTVAP